MKETEKKLGSREALFLFFQYKISTLLNIFQTSTIPMCPSFPMVACATLLYCISMGCVESNR